VSAELIREFQENAKLCPHIHLPIQSGNNDILKKMRRGYTRKRYLEIVNSLREARPAISLTSDFIVGFPGETEGQFEDTLDLLKCVQFDSIFAFKYSPRPGTKASLDFEDDVPTPVKEARLDCLLSLQRKITKVKNEARVGQVEELLITGYDRQKTGRLMGRLADNRIVNFAGNCNLIGSIVRIRLTRALANSMEGEVIG
jgi:tRNA-2-methylthio-N6-dimethylallyladenosine synthase